MDNQHHIEDTTRSGSAAGRSGLPTAVWAVGGVMVALISGLAVALVLRSTPPAETTAATTVTSAGSTTTSAAAKPAAKGGYTGGGGDGGTDSRTTAAAHSCATCGVVESVREVQVKGEGTGLGAVAGGVLGGVVGHQMGGGDGKKALTVLGAVGGGVAGHEVEKRARANTTYEVRVRMADGTLRTVSSAQALKAGTRVNVDGNTLRTANG